MFYTLCEWKRNYASPANVAFSWQVIHAARTLAAHPVSKIAQENMEVFVDVWEAQVEELGKVLRLITAGGDPSKSKCARECILIVFLF